MPMTFKATAGGGDFKSVAAGSHIAVCNLIADLGLQPGSPQYPDPKQKIYVRFEIAAERVQYEKDGKKVDQPAVIGTQFTASMHENATLRKQLEGWRGRKFTDEEAGKFDVSSILGKPCMLTVVEKAVGDKIYTNIASIGPMPKGITPPHMEARPLLYSEDDRSMYDQLPDWLKEKIDKQLTRRPDTRHSAPPSDYGDLGITDDDIPF